MNVPLTWRVGFVGLELVLIEGGWTAKYIKDGGLDVEWNLSIDDWRAVEMSS